MKRPIFYLIFGVAVIATAAAAEWTGWGTSSRSEVSAPRSVRDNPGSYRPTYIYMGSRYPRGK